MRRLFAGVWKVLGVIWFIILCVPAIPIMVVQFTVGRLRNWIERRWPESERARAVSWWVGCLSPIVFVLVLIVAVTFALFWVLEQRRLRGIE